MGCLRTFTHPIQLTKIKQESMEQKVRKPKPVNSKKMWGVFAPNGWLQTRSINSVRKMAIECTIRPGEKWRDYLNYGFYIKRILVDVQVLADAPKPKPKKETEEMYCNECGSEDLAYLENYACGTHWKCRDCSKEHCFAHEPELT
jgi:hypothetical protein